MENPVKVQLTSPPIRLEDLNVLVRESYESVMNTLRDGIDPSESHRYETIVSVERLDP